MKIEIRFLIWFILWTLVYYLQFNTSKLILDKESIDHVAQNLKLYNLIISLVSTVLIFKLYYEKDNLTTNNLYLNYIIIFMLSVSSVLDLKIMRVPNYFLRSILILIIILSLRKNLVKILFDGLLVYIGLYILYITTKKSIGGADVRILSIIALVLGYQNSVLILTYSSWICLAYFTMKKLVRSKTNTEEIAFIPYIYLGYAYLIYS